MTRVPAPVPPGHPALTPESVAAQLAAGDAAATVAAHVRERWAADPDFFRMATADLPPEHPARRAKTLRELRAEIVPDEARPLWRRVTDDAPGPLLPIAGGVVLMGLAAGDAQAALALASGGAIAVGASAVVSGAAALAGRLGRWWRCSGYFDSYPSETRHEAMRQLYESDDPDKLAILCYAASSGNYYTRKYALEFLASRFALREAPQDVIDVMRRNLVRYSNVGYISTESLREIAARFFTGTKDPKIRAQLEKMTMKDSYGCVREAAKRALQAPQG